jgi:protein dithiol:quinone oxidoreductase
MNAVIACLLAPRAFFLSVFAICALLLGYAYFAQYVQGYEPCLLCWVQRTFMFLLGLTALLAGLHNPKRYGYAIWGMLCAVWAGFGAFIAARHVQLQGMSPEELEGCSAPIEYFLNNNEWASLLKNVFMRNMDCGKIDWVFLGQSMPRWVLLWFVVMFIAVLWRGFTAKRYFDFSARIIKR